MENKIITIKSLCEFIWKVEDKYNLLEHEVDGVKVWQYLRMEIYYLIAKELGILEDRKESQQSTSVLFRNSLGLLRNIFFSNPFLGLKKQRDVIVFTHNRSKKIEDKFEDIYTFSLIKELQSKGDSYLCLEKPFQGKHIRKKKSNTKYLDFILSASILYGRFYRIKEKDSLAVIKDVQKELKIATDKSIDLVSLFQNNIGRYKLAHKLYLGLFKKLKPKVIYSVASYSYLGDMIAAAKDLGIKTVELQHGVVSKYHMGYSFTKKQSLAYYSDVFYSWGDFWIKSVENPFNEVRNNGFQYFKNMSNLYQNIFKENQILILSQAALGSKIMSETLRLIDKFSEFQIFYKLHPEEYSMYKIYPAFAKLDSYRNVRFLEECNLYEIMAKSKIQIGVFSTALYEGLGFSCNTFLYNLNGVEYMQDLIDLDYAKILSVDTNLSLEESNKDSSNNFF